MWWRCVAIISVCLSPPCSPHGQDLQPPKHLYIEVLVLADYGDIMTASGPVMLKKDERLLLKRTDVEQLIRQGVLAETSGRR